MCELFQNNIEFVAYNEFFLEKSWHWLNSEPLKTLTDTPDFSKEGQYQWFQSLADRSDYFVQGIKYNEIAVGVWGLKHISTDRAEYFGYIGEMEFWGKGIGKAMISQAIEIAQNKKLKSLYLTVLRTNSRAISLYKKNNFQEISEASTEKMIYMELKL